MFYFFKFIYLLRAWQIYTMIKNSPMRWQQIFTTRANPSPMKDKTLDFWYSVKNVEVKCVVVGIKFIVVVLRVLIIAA